MSLQQKAQIQQQQQVQQTYSGKVVRMVHVFSDEGLAENAEHWFEDNGGKKENEQQQKYYL